MDYKSQLFCQETALRESGLKIRELETTLSSKLEEHTVHVTSKKEELKSYTKKIASLEKDWKEREKTSRELEIELKATVSCRNCRLNFLMLLTLELTHFC